jgi:hypothetical protein
MSRTTTLLALATLALLATGGTLPAQAPPAPCPLELGDEAAIAVGIDAVATPDCLKIRKGKTRVVWTAAEGVRELQILFKDPDTKRPPEDPACTGARCVLEKAKHALKQGEFDYSVVVVRQDGSVVELDPKLIIDP